MPDFTITETTAREIKPFCETYILEAGEKLAGKASLISVSNKIIPAGYKVTIMVSVDVMDIEKL